VLPLGGERRRFVSLTLYMETFPSGSIETRSTLPNGVMFLKTWCPRSSNAIDATYSVRAPLNLCLGGMPRGVSTPVAMIRLSRTNLPHFC
jgi:hypothetical protein